MSKIINQYNKLKEENSKKLYLFECGIFYIFINEDAKTISEKLNLKLINLGDTNFKCGFPIKSKDKYFEMLKDNDIDFELVKAICSPKKKNETKEIPKKEIPESEIIRKLKSINVEYYTEEEALRFLIELKELIK